ncbi:MAG: GNAT family N-acetyltransferase [Victivallaceae bacterium]|jgi:RimJ/RimL family protein N-acetyltransferase
MKIVKIDESGIGLLRRFIPQIGASGSSFRYFNSRPPEVVRNHVVTLLGIDDAGTPVCYGHLDREADTVWLGICVAEGHTGQGLGGRMMTALLEAGDEAGVEEIKLSVDNNNLSGIRLYEKNGFQLISRNDKISFYHRTRPV